MPEFPDAMTVRTVRLHTVEIETLARAIEGMEADARHREIMRWETITPHGRPI
jgi:hypothetical protein